MKVQIIQDGHGKATGVFIPIEEWDGLKSAYPDIENYEEELDDDIKQLLDKRLESIENNPENLRQGDELLQILREKKK